MTTYVEKLRDPKWQRKRLEIMKRDNFKCKKCGDEKTMLSVHHKIYKKGAEPWEYNNSDLITLCKDCHAVIEDIKKKQNATGLKLAIEDFDDIKIYKTRFFNEYRMMFIYWDGIVLVGKYLNSKRVGGFTLFQEDILGVIKLLKLMLK